MTYFENSKVGTVYARLNLVSARYDLLSKHNIPWHKATCFLLGLWIVVLNYGLLNVNMAQLKF